MQRKRRQTGPWVRVFASRVRVYGRGAWQAGPAHRCGGLVDRHQKEVKGQGLAGVNGCGESDGQQEGVLKVTSKRVLDASTPPNI